MIRKRYDTHRRFPDVIGSAAVPVELYDRGIDSQHFLFHLIRAVWLDEVDITPLGVVWLSPQDNVCLVLRNEPGAPISSAEHIPVTYERRGRLQLELGDGLLSEHAINQVISHFPEIVVHLKPEAESGA